MKLNDFNRLIRPLKNKIFLLLGRALLHAVNNSEMTQKIQVVALNGEIITDIERFQEYGFETYPHEESEVAIMFLNGKRDHGIALCVHDRRYRPDDLSEGEVCLYTDEDSGSYFRVHMKRDRTLEIKCNKLNFIVDDDCTFTVGGDMTENVTGNHETNAARIDHN